MKITYYILLLTFPFICACSRYSQDIAGSICRGDSTGHQRFSKSRQLNRVLNEMVSNAVPGIALAVYSDEGWWESAAGFAKIENRQPMQTCNLQYLQSVSKTYMAVAILKLYEQGRIGLDDPAGRYLPVRYRPYLPNLDSVTVRMLLNHTSGVPEYNFDPSYVSYLLQHPGHYFTTAELLEPLKGKKLIFPPGSRHVYTNTNYELLALIADSLTGDHARFISEIIFKPLGLSQTFYRHEANYPEYPLLVNSYWDRYSNSILENVSRMQRMNVATLIGDDGIVATPSDAVKFLKGLVEGKLLAPATLDLMRQWVDDARGRPVYGLGLVHISFEGHDAYGHSGGGIGAGCELYYFPEKHLYFFVAINLGTVTGSPLHKKLGEIKDRLWRTLLQ